MGQAAGELSKASAANGSLVAALCEQRAAWDRRPAVRSLYEEWYAEVAERLSAVPGPTLELGCGIGTFKESVADVLATDVEETPWADEVVDAERIPYEDGALANLVLIDVLHHLPSPKRFFFEAGRVLRPGGRIVILDPYTSPLSGLAYRLFHHEQVDLGADPFADRAQSGSDPMEANGALARLIFWRGSARFTDLFPGLALRERKRLSFLAYPLSGGFGGRRLAPDRVVQAAQRSERLLRPLGALAAFRCLVVLERRREDP